MIRNKKGQFVKGHKVPKKIRKKISISKKGQIPWMKGKKHTKKSKEKNRLAHLGKCPNNALETWRQSGGKPWNKRIYVHLSPKSEFKKGDKRITGKNNSNWKGGITPVNQMLRQSVEYKEWRMKVFQRDYFTCIVCGYRSNKPKDIRADHIKPFSLYPELRFNINNGRTLCIPCDLKIGWNSLREINDKINYWKIA